MLNMVVVDFCVNRVAPEVSCTKERGDMTKAWVAPMPTTSESTVLENEPECFMFFLFVKPLSMDEKKHRDKV